MIKDSIMDAMENLSLEMQRKLLDYAIKLQFQDKGIDGKELVKFSGIIDAEDLNEMKKIIEKDCGKIDHININKC